MARRLFLYQDFAVNLSCDDIHCIVLNYMLTVREVLMECTSHRPQGYAHTGAKNRVWPQIMTVLLFIKTEVGGGGVNYVC